VPLVIDYPACISGEPRRMNAAVLAAQAIAVRRGLLGMRVKPFEVGELAARAARFVINGRRMRIAWDIEHEVFDDAGKPVLGVCEYDPDAPETVMISINGERLGGQPEVFRSTAVHELAHAIFDMPAAFGRRVRKTFRTLAAETQPVRGGPIDWTEWRADEFMGAFLVPLDGLARAVAKQAGTMEMPFRWHTGPNGLPVPCIDVEPTAEPLGWLIETLAEAFGVSPAFIAVRLKKCGLIGRLRQADSRR
jgi:Zn-dependent peptidase ImmA (M78 family)